MSGLQIPGRVELSIELAEAPLASPACLTLNTPSGPHVKVIGGLSKVEHVAATIANHTDFNENWVAGYVDFESAARAYSTHVVSLAEFILAECARRRQPAPVNGQPQS